MRKTILIFILCQIFALPHTSAANLSFFGISNEEIQEIESAVHVYASSKNAAEKEVILSNMLDNIRLLKSDTIVNQSTELYSLVLKAETNVQLLRHTNKFKKKKWETKIISDIRSALASLK